MEKSRRSLRQKQHPSTPEALMQQQNGKNDNFDFTSSHVFPAMLRKIHEAKKTGGPVELWGDGSPLREFLYADDLADAVVYLMKNMEATDIGEFVNIGTGKNLTIKALAETIAEIVGYSGEVKWDATKPNGTPRKLLDVSKLTRLGWQAQTSLKDGIEKAYEWFKENK